MQVFKYTKKGYTLLQNLTAARTEDWAEMVIPLEDDGPFKLEFEGIRGESFEGDIAIDDIEVLGVYGFGLILYLISMHDFVFGR